MATAPLSKQEKKLLKCIEEGKNKKECLIELGIKTENTLLKRVMQLSMKKGQVLSVKGLTEADNVVRFAGPSIIIHRSKLGDAPFSSGDQFTISYEEDKIILEKKE